MMTVGKAWVPAVGTNDMPASSKAESPRTLGCYLVGCSYALIWVNFVVYFVVAGHLGGDAINGHVRDGHYFLCAHGFCVEVTKAVFTYSWWHSIIVMVTCISSIILPIVLGITDAALGKAPD